MMQSCWLSYSKDIAILNFLEVLAGALLALRSYGDIVLIFKLATVASWQRALLSQTEVSAGKQLLSNCHH